MRAARLRGEPGQYPRLSMHPADDVEQSPVKRTPAKAVATPVTPIAPPRKDGASGRGRLPRECASGSRSMDIGGDSLPFSIGRSRNQALVVDWAHRDVSGHHLDIVRVDEGGATALVHGDNGVMVDGTLHGPGTEFRWQPGETIKLGQATESAMVCELTPSSHAG